MAITILTSAASSVTDSGFTANGSVTANEGSYTTDGTDTLSSGTASASRSDSGSPANCCDNDTGTYNTWNTIVTPQWWKYDYGVGVSKVIGQLRIFPDGGYCPKDFQLQGSNDNSNWTTLYTGVLVRNAAWQSFDIDDSSIPYRYYRVYFTSGYSSNLEVKEFEFIEKIFDQEVGICYAEGSDSDPNIYDNKIIAASSFTVPYTISEAVTGEFPATVYNYRAYVIDGTDVTYGDIVRVNTDPADGSAGTTSWSHVHSFTPPSNVEFRGGIVIESKMYICVGDYILTVSTTGVVISLGTISTTTGRVGMAYNGTQILIVDGTTSGHYITTADDSLNNISDGDFPAATSCTFMDGYFIVTIVSSGKFYISGLYAANTWDALDFATAEGDPDNLLRCYHATGNLWLFGSNSIEVWYNSGNADFPFSRVQGSLVDDGLAGVTAITLIKDQFYFLCTKREVLRTSGYQREKISSIHMDKELQSYTTVSDAIGFEYRIEGHLFFVLTFPTEDKTWVYDLTTDYWHEWQSFKTAGVATYGKHRATISFFFNGKWYVGDYSKGYIYELSMSTYTDNGDLIKRTRRGQVINKEKVRVAHNSVELDFEAGVGIGGSGTGSNPLVTLNWSDDGGKTWDGNQTRSLGAIELCKQRVIWRRLGMARSRIYEVVVTSPVQFAILGAYADLEETNG